MFEEFCKVHELTLCCFGAEKGVGGVVAVGVKGAEGGCEHEIEGDGC